MTLRAATRDQGAGITGLVASVGIGSGADMSRARQAGDASGSGEAAQLS
jgi:hypothetical protein